MTVIAWDGKTLAADKAASNCGWKNTVTKIYSVPGGMVGFSGDSDAAHDLLEWFRAGRVAANYPKCQSSDSRASAVFISETGQLMVYDKSANPNLYEQPFYALGSGRDYALATMYLGFDARRAVEVACAMDSDCGNGIDTLTLEATDAQA